MIETIYDNIIYTLPEDAQNCRAFEFNFQVLFEEKCETGIISDICFVFKQVKKNGKNGNLHANKNIHEKFPISQDIFCISLFFFIFFHF